MTTDNEPPLDISLDSSAAPPGAERPVRLLLSRAALEAIRAHGRQDPSRECGGMLVGEALEGRGATWVVVEGVISAQHTDAHRGSVTFTHETWDQVNREKDARYPDLRLVGWYHTHPGFGIFLSEYDQFIQRHFFDLAWNVAFVLDPLSGETGAFGWQGGAIVRLPAWELYGPLAEAPAPEAEDARRPEVVPAVPPVAVLSLPRRGVLAWVTVTLLSAILVLSVLNLLRPPPPAPLPPPVPPPVMAPLPPELPSASAATPGETWYTVQPGDTLWGLAKRFYGRGDMFGLIAAANGLAGRETGLDAGMRLRIPLPPGGETAGGGKQTAGGTGD